MQGIYRELSGRARVAGILGWPVAHSRSPMLHGFWLERHRIDGAYVPLAVPPERLATAVRGLLAAGFAGCNVTIPHKEAAFLLCDSVSADARRIEAVNTLVFRDGRIEGNSTDGAGFLASLRDHGVDPSAPALVLGAGGAARAIVAALIDAGARVTITNRTAGRSESLLRLFPTLRPLAWERVSAALGDHALLVNTTAAGMAGGRGLDIDLAPAPPGLTVADIVYVPLATPLLAAAAARGLATVPGLGMLLHQAVPGFAAWFGVTPAVDRELYDFVAADIAGATGERGTEKPGKGSALEPAAACGPRPANVRGPKGLPGSGT